MGLLDLFNRKGSAGKGAMEKRELKAEEVMRKKAQEKQKPRVCEPGDEGCCELPQPKRHF